eukprot:Hpha_TRINITY_DN35822_c0_g1::TRINITY_DN35822_c0_g1_i1::g.84918::m.84918
MELENVGPRPCTPETADSACSLFSTGWRGHGWTGDPLRRPIECAVVYDPCRTAVVPVAPKHRQHTPERWPPPQSLLQRCQGPNGGLPNAALPSDTLQDSHGERLPGLWSLRHWSEEQRPTHRRPEDPPAERRRKRVRMPAPLERRSSDNNSKRRGHRGPEPTHLPCPPRHRLPPAIHSVLAATPAVLAPSPGRKQFPTLWPPELAAKHP